MVSFISATFRDHKESVYFNLEIETDQHIKDPTAAPGPYDNQECQKLVGIAPAPTSFTTRVAKCHGYDGYIRVKILASWGKSLGEHTILQN